MAAPLRLLGYVVRLMKLRQIKWTGHLEHVGEKGKTYRIFMGKLEGKNHLENLRVNGDIILNYI